MHWAYQYLDSDAIADQNRKDTRVLGGPRAMSQRIRD